MGDDWDIEGRTREQLLLELSRVCKVFGMSVADAIREKSGELQMRHFLKCVPNSRVKPQFISRYLELVLGQSPSESLIRQVEREARDVQLSEEEYLAMEERQNGRCALCGCYLVASSKPQVDHVVPVAFGGKNTTENYQILCRRCNQGKGQLFGWIMGAPFFKPERVEIGAQLRYCVLSRFRGTCSESSCEATSRVADLFVIPIVPVGEGGRLIFDNLVPVCREHRDAREKKLKETARMRIRQSRLGRVEVRGLPR
ncbi:MAG: HNH endonuclease [Nannocystaceae bacterium]